MATVPVGKAAFLGTDHKGGIVRLDMIEGIDLSHNNGTVDFDKLVKAGKKFVYAKATEGTDFADPMFHHYRSEAARVGMIFGAYHFMHVDTQASEQAAFFLKTVGAFDPEDLPPAIDVEPIKSGPSWGTLSTIMRVQKVEHWISTIEDRSAAHPAIYCSPVYWKGIFGEADFRKYKLWAARYNKLKEPDLSGTCWKDWWIWQYSDRGRLPGTDGDVDLNQMRITK